MPELQNDPLLPGYSFNAHLVAGLTPIDAGGYLDFFIDRPLGMKGFYSEPDGERGRRN